MFNGYKIICIALVLLMGISVNANAHPSITIHSHNDTNTKWQLNAPPYNGDYAHNHVTARNFGGYNNPRAPYTTDSCWDNALYRQDQSGNFDFGHCYMNSSSPLQFRFITVDKAWTAAEKQIVRDAFDEYNDIPSPLPFGDNVIGLKVQENAGGIIRVAWQDLPAAYGGGVWDPNIKKISFDSSGPSWSTERNPSNMSQGEMHLFSTAMHEIGHSLGLEHQIDSDDIMKPGVDLSDLDIDSIIGIQELYSQPPPAPGAAACSMYVFLGCHQPTCAAWEYGYSASNASEYRIEYKGSGGSWNLKTVTPNTSYFPHLGGNLLQWRIRGQNSGGNGEWCVFYTSGECNGGGGGPLD